MPESTSSPSSAALRGLAQALRHDDEAAPADATVFGDYQLEEEIARGGMGIVYRAWQVSLTRPVAVKVMREGGFADGREISRFRQEAEAAAALRHPGIVPVYESGTQGGRFYYAMEWIDGPNLAEVTRANPATARQAASWLREVAEAIAHAHARGVIHRDLKPANVLLDPEGRTRVTDFGMAQRADTAGGLTLSGQMLGTPGYMAPEIAAGQARTAGTAADVYGLGALLFHLLTGRAPFIGESHATVLRQVMEAEPVSPRLLNPSVPRDLETICLKALEREPACRYPGAQEMAHDLDRFLHGEPVRACPVSGAARAWRWCRRKPALAASLVAIALLGAGIVETTLRSNRRIETLRREAVERLYASDMRLALQYIAEGKYGAAAALVERHEPDASGEDLRGFEWRLAREFCRSGEVAALEHMSGTVRAVAVSPDGRWLVAAAENLRVWEAQDGAPLLRRTMSENTRALALAPDSRRLAVSLPGGGLRVLALENLTTQHTAALPEDVAALAWRADGSALELIAGKQQWRWSPGAGDPAVAAELPGTARQPCFSRDATLAAFMHEAAGPEEAVRFTVWDAAAGRSLQTVPLPIDRIVRGYTFSPDGRTLATGDYSGRVAVWERPFAAEKWNVAAHRGMVDEVAFATDGRFIAASGGQSVLLLSATGRGEAGWLRGHRSMVNAAAFSPDNCHILTGDESGAVKWWKVPGAGKPEDIPSGGGILASQDGGMLAWAAGPRMVLAPAGAAPRVMSKPDNTKWPLLSREAAWFPSSRDDEPAVLRVASDGSGESFNLPGSLAAVAPDDRWLVCTAPASGLPVLHDRTGVRPDMISGDEPRPATPAFSADGSLCALGFRNGEVRVLATSTGAEVCRFRAHRRWAYGRGFSPDGRLLATVGFDGHARLWEMPGGRLVRDFVSSFDTLWSVALSPDGRRLAAGTGESSVILWNTENGLETGLIALGPPQQTVELLTFTPDGAALYAHGRLLRAP
ncbi:MAG: serine/threonine-protein kinase [Verrucomicrobiales bacterium]